jgi:hypothetical protein
LFGGKVRIVENNLFDAHAALDQGRNTMRLYPGTSNQRFTTRTYFNVQVRQRQTFNLSRRLVDGAFQRNFWTGQHGFWRFDRGQHNVDDASLIRYNATMKKLVALFYRTYAGNQPVKEWLINAAPADRKIIGADIASVEFGWPVGMPVCKSIGGGIWEVRSTIKSGRVEARVYFAIDSNHAVLLHAHDGKDNQSHEIRVARDRWSDYMNRKRRG